LSRGSGRPPFAITGGQKSRDHSHGGSNQADEEDDGKFNLIFTFVLIESDN
jgi:hypothetical protein